MFISTRTSPPKARLGPTHPPLSRAARLTVVSVLLSLMLVMFAAPRATHAQVLYGSLTGNVTDQKGDSVPGAKVEVVNTSTGEARDVTTDERGGYTFSSLQVGVYKLTIALSSFKTLIKEDLRIEPNKIYRFDSQLEVGEVRETVVVTSDTGPPLQTDRADVNIQIQQAQAANLSS